MSKLFTKFDRLPSSRPTADEQSTGLGLYITKKQIEVMGGEITAASEGLNRGSTFTVMLPLHMQGEMERIVPDKSMIFEDMLPICV